MWGEGLVENVIWEKGLAENATIGGGGWQKTAEYRHVGEGSKIA